MNSEISDTEWENQSPTLQVLSLDNIRVDRKIQSREETNLEFQKEFSEALLNGAVFPPIDVFFDGKIYWLADGFHRVGAFKSAAMADKQFRSIKARIYKGSRRDAIVFSSGANQKFSIKRTPADIKKSVYMLLEDHEWLKKGYSVLAKHVGTSVRTISIHRTSFCVENNIDPHIPMVTESGIIKRLPRRISGKYISRVCVANSDRDAKGTPAYTGIVRGERYYLGTDKKAAEQKLHDLVESSYVDGAKRVDLQSEKFNTFLRIRKILVTAVGRTAGLHLAGCTYENKLIVTSTSSDVFTLTSAVGRLMLLSTCLPECDEKYLIGYHEDYPQAFIDAILKLHISVLTPEQFVRHLNKDK